MKWILYDYIITSQNFFPINSLPSDTFGYSLDSKLSKFHFKLFLHSSDWFNLWIQAGRLTYAKDNDNHVMLYLASTAQKALIVCQTTFRQSYSSIVLSHGFNFYNKLLLILIWTITNITFFYSQLNSLPLNIYSENITDITFFIHLWS